ncbi:MAG: hypothetical protein KKG47_13915 [Proteobacteria bacterium]|nr:hypothetical protein [Pseudomonadota bacterium]MBU1739105.1 hypothetical protein [Pseudomonadota bacterium]
MICLNLVLPVRIIAFTLIAGNWVYIMLNLDSIDVITIFITMLNLVLACTMLKECGRSVSYHREIDRLEGKSNWRK